MKVATLLPIYKDDSDIFFKLCLKSLLSQTYPTDIIILVDGPIIKNLSNILELPNTNIIVLKYKVNRGLATVLNEGIRYCLSKDYEFIARMDADDIAFPYRIEKQLNYLLQNPKVDVLGGAIEEIDETGKPTGKVIKYPITHEECFRFFSKRDPMAHPAVMFRKSFFLKAGFYNESYRKNQDTQLWYQGFRHGCIFANLPEVILQFRVTNSFYQSRRGGWKRATKMLSDRIRINRDLKYGIKGNIFAFGMFLITISPTFLRKLAYKYLR